MAKTDTRTVSEKFEAAVETLGGAAIARPQVNAFLKELGAHIGVADLALDDGNTAWLTVDGDVELALLHLPHLPGLIVATPVPNVPTNHPVYLKTLLQAHMSWSLTRGGVFAKLPNVEPIMFCWLLLIADRDLERVDRELAEMVDFAKFWIGEIDTALEAERTGTAAVDTAPKGSIRV